MSLNPKVFNNLLWQDLHLLGIYDNISFLKSSEKILFEWMTFFYILNGIKIFKKIFIYILMKVVLEYIWQDHNGGFRSKTKVTDMDEVTLDKLSMWNYDGSSTEQADGSDSEVYIKPVSMYKDPF